MLSMSSQGTGSNQLTALKRPEMEATLTKEAKMKSLLKLMFVVSFTTSLLTACIVSPGPGGYGVTVAPALPAVVELNVAQPY